MKKRMVCFLCLLLAGLLTLSGCFSFGEPKESDTSGNNSESNSETYVVEFDTIQQPAEELSMYYLEQPLTLSEEDLNAALESVMSASSDLPQNATTVETYPIYGEYLMFTDLMAYVFYQENEAEALAVLEFDPSDNTASLVSFVTKEQTKPNGTIAESALFWLRYPAVLPEVEVIGFYLYYGRYLGSIGYSAQLLIQNEQQTIFRCTEGMFSFEHIFPFQTVEDGHQAYQDYLQSARKTISLTFTNGLYSADESYDKKYLDGETLYCEWYLTSTAKLVFSFSYTGEASDFEDPNEIVKSEWNWKPVSGILLVDGKTYTLMDGDNADWRQYAPLLTCMGEPNRKSTYQNYNDEEVVFAEWNPVSYLSIYYIQDWSMLQIVVRNP